MKIFKSERLAKYLYCILIFVVILHPASYLFIPEGADQDYWFPAWRNDLFAFSAREIRAYEVRILKLDDTEYPDEPNLFEVIPTFEGNQFSPSIRIKEMGLGLEQKDEELLGVAKKVFETWTFKKYKYVRYSVYFVDIDVVEKYLFKKNKNEKKLAEYIYDKTR